MPSKPGAIIEQIRLLPCKKHSEIFLSFYRWITEEQDSGVVNAVTYLSILRLFSNFVGSKPLGEITKGDIVEFLDTKKRTIDIDPEKRWVTTWNHNLSRLFGFFRWYHNHDKDDDKSNWETPDCVKTIKKKKNKRISKYSPNDVWSEEELLLAVKYCDNLRDRLILCMLWDMAARNHELCKMKIRDIVIKEQYAEASTSWDTKTGVRTNPIIIGFPYLVEYLNNHPFANDPDSYLLLSTRMLRPLQPFTIANMTKSLKGKIQLLLDEEQILQEDRDKVSNLLKKPWNPYLLGRHSSITEKTDYMSDYQLRQYSGWSIDSNRAIVYTHRKTKQVINPILEEHGIIQKKEKKLSRRVCTRCKSVMSIEAVLCTSCGFVLSTKGWQETKDKEDKEKQDLEDKVTQMMKDIEKLKGAQPKKK